MQDTGFGAYILHEDLEFRVEGCGFGVWLLDLRCWVYGSCVFGFWFKVHAYCLLFMVYGLRLIVCGLGSRLLLLNSRCWFLDSWFVVYGL